MASACSRQFEGEGFQMRAWFVARRSLLVAFAFCLLTVGLPGSLAAADAAPPDANVEQGATQEATRPPDRLGPPTRDGRELLNLRTRSSRTFVQSDGTRLKVISAGPVNFRDENGEWQPIDNRLRASAAVGYAHENTANSYDLQLPADVGVRPVRVQVGGAWVSYALDGARGTGSVAGNAKTYRAVLPATDLRLSALPERVKEDLVLRDASAPRSFSYTLETSSGLSARLNAGGGVDFVDSTGRKRFRFSAPYMDDRAGAHRDLRYGLRPIGSGYTLTLELDARWLESPARRWPVIVDPSFEFVGPRRDCHITGGASANTSFCSSQVLDVGWDGQKASRSLLYFPIEESFPAPGAIITNAELRLHLNSRTTTNPATLTAHRLTNDWYTDATWNNRDGAIPWSTPGGDFEAASAAKATGVGGALGWQSWYPVNLAQDWTEGSATNYGFLLKQEQENVNNVLSFASQSDPSSRLPELRLYYHWRTGMRPFYTYESEQLSDRHAAHVNTTTGNLVVEAPDLQIAGTGLDLSVGRYYNSLSATMSEFGGREFGSSWILGTGVDVYLKFFPGGAIGYYGESGFATRFLPNDDGSYRSPSGVGATLTRNQDGSYKLTSHADGSKQNFRADGMLASLEDANGNRIEFSYVASNWMQVTNGWKLTQIRDTQGRTTTLTYNDTIERLTRITDPSGRIYQYGYNGNGQLTSYTDPANKVTTYTYNGAGMLSRITHPKGNQTRFTYDADRRVLTVKRVTNNSTGVGPTTTYTYGLRADNPTLCDDPAWIGCTETTDPNSNRTKHYWDPHRLVRKAKDALGNNVSTTYTADFNVQTYTAASGGVGTNGYDTNNNLTSSRSATGAESRWEYNDATHRYYASRTIDPRGKPTSFAYDPNGNVNEITNAALSTAWTTYNANGTVASTSDFKGTENTNCPFNAGRNKYPTVCYGYDAQGNLTSVNNPAPLGDSSYTYDSLSRVRTETDGKGQTTTYAYDALDRITSITYHDSSAITYTYDANGNVLTMADNTGTTSYEYDALNRLTKETLPGPKVNSYFYDNASNLSAFEDSGGRVNYAYDARNLLVTLTEPSTRQIDFAYDADHMRTETRYPNGVTQFVEYDAANRLKWIYAQKNPPSDSLLTDFKYCYRLPLNADCTGGTDIGLRQRVIDKDGNATVYTYDDLGRLTLAEERTSTGTLVNSYAYSYDANSNRTSQTVNGTTTTYDHNAADQLTRAGATTFSYDANGNELSRSDGRSAAYNMKDQTTSMTPPGGSAISMSYTGPAQFRRVSAGGTTFQDNALGLGRETTGGASSTFVRDVSGFLLEQRTSSGDHYYLVDGLGSVVALTNLAGDVAVTYKYEPFGKIVSSTGSVTNPWRFLGARGVYSDVQTGLYKMGTRYYDPAIGRFTQTDPVAGGGANAYDYANQDPCNSQDVTGTVVCPAEVVIELEAFGRTLLFQINQRFKNKVFSVGVRIQLFGAGERRPFTTSNYPSRFFGLLPGANRVKFRKTFGLRRLFSRGISYHVRIILGFKDGVCSFSDRGIL
jgi:RHS repeat-associated protein